MPLAQIRVIPRGVRNELPLGCRRVNWFPTRKEQLGTPVHAVFVYFFFAQHFQPTFYIRPRARQLLRPGEKVGGGYEPGPNGV